MEAWGWAWRTFLARSARWLLVGGIVVFSVASFQVARIYGSPLDIELLRSGDDLTVLPRHSAALRRARESLAEALAEVERDGAARLSSPELVAGAMRAALDALGEIAGRIDPDDVIGRVFASFCVGK